jgi:F-type H+-transporting ATPase subunit epsilon
MPLTVDLVSPERTLLSTEAQMVMARTVGGGDLAILPGHAPFIGALDTWKLTVRPPEGDDIVAAVHGGFIEVTGDHVKILSDLAEMADQIDVARARRAADEAQAAVARGDDAAAEATLRRNHARIIAAGEGI